MNHWPTILGMALVTFLIRYPVLALVGRIELPERVFKALRYVPPAVLTAIIVPGVLMPDGQSLSITYTNVHLIAGVVAGLVSWRSKNLLLTIVVGMAVFLGLRLVVFAGPGL